MNNKPSNICPPSNSSIIFKESPEITSQMSSDNSNKDLTTQYLLTLYVNIIQPDGSKNIV